MTTPIIFRMWYGGDYHLPKFDKPELIALFPTIPGSYNTCSSFQHVGQHGDADYNYIIRSSRPATESEYADLKRELETIYEYESKVYKRWQNWFNEVRRDEIAQFKIRYCLQSDYMYGYARTHFIARISRWCGVNPEYVTENVYQLQSSEGVTDYTTIEDAFKGMSEIVPLRNWVLVKDGEQCLTLP